MIAIENDIASVYSESTIYDSEIVAREIEDYERNQRLRQFGLLADIEEERQIDFMETIRNCDYSDRDRLDRDFSETPEEQENSTVFVNFKKLSCNNFMHNFITCFKKRKLAILFLAIAITITVITLGYFWFTKHKNIFGNIESTTPLNTTPKEPKNTDQVTIKGGTTTKSTLDGKKG